MQTDSIVCLDSRDLERNKGAEVCDLKKN
uniref:Uncharacterized protein n=1 Tax=Anguilla anguilla TaxID=7936 RepID=A0A0E9QBA8_ANGAN